MVRNRAIATVALTFGIQLAVLAAQGSTAQPYVSPSTVDFGQVQAGTGAVDEVAITVSDVPSATVSATSSNPDVRAVRVGDPAGANRGVLKYRVSLSPDARLGAITGALTVVETVPAKQGVMTLTLAKIPLTGCVKGEVTATPETLSLGNVRAGASGVWHVVIRGSMAPALRFLRVVDPGKYLSVSRSPVSAPTLVYRDPNAPATPQPVMKPSFSAPEPVVLAVRLASNAPDGPLATAIVVETADGQQLAIPVTASVLR